MRGSVRSEGVLCVGVGMCMWGVVCGVVFVCVRGGICVLCCVWM